MTALASLDKGSHHAGNAGRSAVTGVPFVSVTSLLRVRTVASIVSDTSSCYHPNR